MANSILGFIFTMKNEDPTLAGVVVDEPHGAKARYGVNSLAHPEAITDGFYEMPKGEAWCYAMRIFIQSYWTKVSGDDIDSQLLANKICDLGYVMGPESSGKIVQRAANQIIGHDELLVDGQIGPKTLAQVKGLDRILLYNAIKDFAKQRFKDIAAANPDEAQYLAGWLKRVDA